MFIHICIIGWLSKVIVKYMILNENLVTVKLGNDEELLIFGSKHLN